MKKHITWSTLPVSTKIGVLALFVGLCGVGWSAGSVITAQTSDDLSASAWKWRKHTLPLAPSASATTSPATRENVKAAQKKSTTPKPTTTTATPTPTPTPNSTTPTTTQPQWPAQQTPTPTPTPTPAPTPTPTQPSTTPAAGEIRFDAYITAYTYWDNTPPGSAAIAFAKSYGYPTVHEAAGGTGTFSDPITLAVGHSYATGKHTVDYPVGTKFYLPYLRKYFIVEDLCGDGPTPEKGPCHTGYQGKPWLDVWIDGANGSRSVTDRCASDITEVHAVIQNPAANYAVVAGPVYNNACAAQFSDTPTIAL